LSLLLINSTAPVTRSSATGWLPSHFNQGDVAAKAAEDNSTSLPAPPGMPGLRFPSALFSGSCPRCRDWASVPASTTKTKQSL